MCDINKYVKIDKNENQLVMKVINNKEYYKKYKRNYQPSKNDLFVCNTEMTFYCMLKNDLFINI
jgi:hypothetical protein